MSTREFFNEESVLKSAGYMSPLKTTVETAFYANNVRHLETMEEVYELAHNLNKVIEVDIPVSHTEELGLPSDAKVLLVNDGDINQ